MSKSKRTGKTDILRRMLVLALASVCVLSLLAGCGKKKPEANIPEPTEESTEEPSTDDVPETDTDGAVDNSGETTGAFDDDAHSYKLDKILIEEMAYGDIAYNDDCFVVGITNYDYDYEYADEESYPDGYLTLDVTFYDYDGREIGGFVEHNDSSDSYYDFNIDSKGNVYFIHGIQNYDENRGYFTAYELLGYNKKGEIIDSALFEDADDDFRLRDIIIDDNDRLLALTNEGIMTFKNRAPADRITFDDAEDFANFYPLSDGDILVSSYGVEDFENSIINFDSRSRKDIGSPSFLMSSVFSVNEGSGDELMICADNGIYKFDPAADKCEKVMAFPVTNRMVTCLDDVKLCDDGSIIGSFYDYDLESHVVARFTPDDLKSDSREKLIFGCIGMPDDIYKQIYSFNEKSDDYRIIVHDYSNIDMEYDYEKGYRLFNEDMMAGNGPDVMLLSNGVPFKAYMSKGLLADLKPMAEADPAIDLDDYAPNVIEALSMNGKLYVFSPDFIINTAVCKSAYMNSTSGNKLSDFMYTSNWTGASVYSQDNTRSSLFYNIMRNTADDYIDWENLTCDFDNTEFQKILSFANTYPSQYNYTYDDSHEGPYSGYALPFRNGEVLCEIRSIYDFNEYLEARFGVFGDDISMVGFPTTGSVGSCISCYNCIAISEGCDHKDGAWEFVKRFFDPNIADQMYLNLPTARIRLEKAVRSAGEKYKSYEDEYNFTWETPTYLVGSEYVELTPLSKKEGDALLNEIYKINRLSSDYNEVYTILSEESEGYFMGAYDASTAARSIQEKMTKYLDSLK